MEACSTYITFFLQVGGIFNPGHEEHVVLDRHLVIVLLGRLFFLSGAREASTALSLDLLVFFLHVDFLDLLEFVETASVRLPELVLDKNGEVVVVV